MGSFWGPGGVFSRIPKDFPVPVALRPRPWGKARVTSFSFFQKNFQKNLVIFKATGSETALAISPVGRSLLPEWRLPIPSRHLKTFSKKIDWGLKFLETLSDIPNAAREQDLRATPSPRLG